MNLEKTPTMASVAELLGCTPYKLRKVLLNAGDPDAAAKLRWRAGRPRKILQITME
jgi:hypothetical protein